MFYFAGRLMALSLVMPVLLSAESLPVIQSNYSNGYPYTCRSPAEPKGGLAKRTAM